MVGFDDIRFARYTEPPLTTIAQPMREIGEGTVRLLLAILHDDTITPESVTLPHTLIIRASPRRRPRASNARRRVVLRRTGLRTAHDQR